MENNNPYPQFITDDCSGQEFVTDKWLAFEEGYTQGVRALLSLMCTEAYKKGKVFSNRISERRKELGFSQTKLACLIGMAHSTLSDLELGKRQPWPKARNDLAKALGVSTEVLFPDAQ